MRRVPAIGIVLAIALVTPSDAYRAGGPPAFEITQSSVGIGGGASSGGVFSLAGTLGQPEVGEASGGIFSLTGGIVVPPPPTICPADADGDGSVGIDDFLGVLASWGPCAGACPSDSDGDGDVGINDFLAVLAQWGACP